MKGECREGRILGRGGEGKNRTSERDGSESECLRAAAVMRQELLVRCISSSEQES